MKVTRPPPSPPAPPPPSASNPTNQGSNGGAAGTSTPSSSAGGSGTGLPQDGSGPTVPAGADQGVEEALNQALQYFATSSLMQLNEQMAEDDPEEE